MNSSQLRQSFLDFFASKQHSIVPSASLMPTSPNLLFTNAGMNQFVPYFLGEREAPFKRAADTQKCIRAGGKHNDLDDVGLDTYHHTFFEMLGNWSFGDYFKKEAIEWGWELLTKVWMLPKDRLYVTVYQPGSGDPADFDQEAYNYWKAIFEAEGMDPKSRILTGGKKDNFWMMGDTGPCGPCSEVHIDLTPHGDSEGKLVNADSPYCIEIWNLVFIQFNAEEDGTFRPLKARHVDTGMGFERVAGIIATTKNFTDYSLPPSNYNCDLFTPIFTRISEMCGQSYGATMPANPKKLSSDEMRDVAFRVLADHARTLSCSIADGILPGNEGRNYVLRRILRRAVMYGRRLNLAPGSFVKLVDPVVSVLGEAFPELVAQQEIIRRVISSEESAFDRTIDRGIQMFEKLAASSTDMIAGADAFELYDTYGFPLDLTQILAQEKGLKIDTAGFETAMEAQRTRARAAQKKSVISVTETDGTVEATAFTGYDWQEGALYDVSLLDVISSDGTSYALFDKTPFYAEMGGQVGDCGWVHAGGQRVAIADTIKNSGGQYLHRLTEAGKASDLLAYRGSTVLLELDTVRRSAIERHHSATHILHWALRKVLGEHVRQAGSFVGPERLRFDFAHFEAIQPAQLIEIERLCNERILANEQVRWYETAFDAKPAHCLAFFGEKYGSLVRVVEIGDFSAELCGGTHVRSSGELGLIKLVGDSAIAAGTRRVEAVAGTAALTWVDSRLHVATKLAADLSVTVGDLPARVEDLQQKLQATERELKSLKAKLSAEQALDVSKSARNLGNLQVLATVLTAENPDNLRQLAASIAAKLNNPLVVAGAAINGKASVVALASPAAIAEGYKAGDIVRQLTSALEGKGGGKPDFAMGGGSRPDLLSPILQQWVEGLNPASGS